MINWKAALTAVLLILGALFVCPPDEAKAQQVNTIDLTTAIAEVAQKSMPAWSISRYPKGSRSHRRSSLRGGFFFALCSSGPPQSPGLTGGRCGDRDRHDHRTDGHIVTNYHVGRGRDENPRSKWHRARNLRRRSWGLIPRPTWR